MIPGLRLDLWGQITSRCATFRPTLPCDADRIYINSTYQTPASHLRMHCCLARLPRLASSSCHHLLPFFPTPPSPFSPNNRRFKKKTFIHIWECFSFKPTFYILLFGFFRFLPSMSGLVSYRRVSLRAPAKTTGSRDDPYSRINYLLL